MPIYWTAPVWDASEWDFVWFGFSSAGRVVGMRFGLVSRTVEVTHSARTAVGQVRARSMSFAWGS